MTFFFLFKDVTFRFLLQVVDMCAIMWQADEIVFEALVKNRLRLVTSVLLPHILQIIQVLITRILLL